MEDFHRESEIVLRFRHPTTRMFFDEILAHRWVGQEDLDSGPLTLGDVNVEPLTECNELKPYMNI